MTNIIISLLLLFCCSLSAYGAGSRLFSWPSLDGLDGTVPPPLDGVCIELVKPFGYACEDHTVATKAGYIVGLQRIGKGQAGGASGANPPVPVLLMHGLLLDGATWLVLSPNQSLALSLADNGFDVWIGNTRGTDASNAHISLKSHEPAFWDWSWDELASDELPAVAQYIQDQTGQKLHYVGHSTGTTTVLAALSKKQLTNTLRSATVLSPIAYLGQTPSTGGKVAADIMLANASYWLKDALFNPLGPDGALLLNQICANPAVDCTDMSSTFLGPTCCIDREKFGLLLIHFSSVATKNLIHLAQMIKHGTIAMYDYDNGDENMKHYGTATPPLYNMSDIPNDFPLYIGHGGQDAVADLKDVRDLLDSLKDHDKDKLVVQYIESYGYPDFVLGTNARQVVYDPLMAFLKSH